MGEENFVHLRSCIKPKKAKMKNEQTVTNETGHGKSLNVKPKLRFGRLAALTALAGLCVGPSIQKSSAVIPPSGGYSPLVAGSFSIVNVKNGEAIDANGSTTSGSEVVQKPRIYGQFWTFSQNSDGTWNIVSQDSHLALDDGNTSANNSHVIQYTPNSSNNNQHWYVEVQSDQTYKITNKASGKVLDSGNISGTGIPVIQYTSNNGSQQRWNLYYPAD